jgi:hypothetical protein
MLFIQDKFGNKSKNVKENFSENLKEWEWLKNWKLDETVREEIDRQRSC